MSVDRLIRKRDGSTVQSFDERKIREAIRAAWLASGPLDEGAIERVLSNVVEILPSGIVDVEVVQDAVELALLRSGRFQVAKAFILYRQHRAEARALRGKKPDPTAIGDYIHASKYARFRPELGRREVYAETVARVEAMHVGRFPALADEIRWAFDLVREKKLLPSMRSMQFGGPAILANHCKIYNCAYTLIDRIEAFSEAVFLLLCGCGVGYSVQFDHVAKLPILTFVDPKRVRHHIVADTIEGWADALKALLQSYVSGEYLEISYHEIRSAGSLLKRSGGRAPGHLGLKTSLERIRAILDGAQGRRLRSIECHRIMCCAADAPLSGGVRRSAMIALFSLDDSEMMNCKTGNWFVKEPWLANANNSVVLRRGDVKREQFNRIFGMTRQWGEPGVYFVNDLDYGTNPCAEVGLYPVLIVDEWARARLAERGINVTLGARFTGFAFCNLCEINASKLTSLEDFLVVGKAAALLGTLQATYTKMPYLGWVSEMLAEREALLGVGMTGMLDAPAIACNPRYQRMVAAEILSWNRKYARELGVRPTARATLIKPSGTTSLALGCVASGHHAHHARRYFRRVVADELEFVFQVFRRVNPHMCVRKPDGKWVIEFPVEAPDGATVKADLSAVQFLEMVKSTQRNWVIPGTQSETYAPGLTHNVSNTIHVKEDEWEAVADYLWANSEFFSGVSLLPATADKMYAYAPHEEVVTEVDEARWNTILASYKPVDYAAMVETDDRTNLTGEAACAGGACTVV